MRYLRLYLHFLRFSFSKALEFRLDFSFRIVMDITFYAVNLAFFTVLYGHTRLLGGWTLDQIYLFVCGYLLVDALHMAVFANNLWWLPIFINRGDLDYYLVRPVSSLFFLSLRDFAANSFVNVLIAGGLVGWAVTRYPQPLGAGRIAAYLLLLMLGVFLLFLIRLLFIVPTFWLHSSRGLLEASWSLGRFAERPAQIYRGWLRTFVTTVLPFAFLATVPARVLFDGMSLELAVRAAAVTVALTTVVLWFWGRGLKAYASASS